MERHAMDGRERRGVVRVGEVTEMQRREIPMGCPQIELPAPPVSFPLPSVPATFPVWPPPPLAAEHAAMAESAAISHKIVSALLDRQGPQAEVNLATAFAIIFKKIDRPSDKANMDLVAEVLDLRTRVTERLESQRGDALATAQAAHAAVFSQCRVAKDTRDKLLIELNSTTAIAQGVQGRLMLAKAAAADLEASRPPRENYPSEAELKGWWDRLTAERAKASDVQREFNLAQGEVNRIGKELQAAEAEFRKLTGEEQRLAEKAENRSHYNELGIAMPAPLQEL
jgi:hypothetical protein